MEKSKFFVLLISFFTFIALHAKPSSSYNGNSGVLETPNARIMPDWNMRLFLNKDNPYTYYGVTFTPLPFLETNFHMTQLSGKQGFSNNSSYGSYKDKSISFKLLLNKESKYLPSLVLGADDFWGTALYTSKYIATSKKIYDFDFTVGYSKGRLGGEDLNKYAINTSNTGSANNEGFKFLTNTDWKGGKPFGSIVYSPIKQLDILAEYSPINYTKDKINPFINSKNKLPKSKYNFGLKYKYKNNSIFSLSYQRGNTLAFGYTYQFGFNRNGMFTHLPDLKWKASEKIKNTYKDISEKTLSDKLSNEVVAEKFKNVSTAVNENKIWSEITNTRYHNDLKAVGRAISTINEVAPKKYNTIYLTLKEKYVPTKTFKINRKDFNNSENQKVNKEYMQKALNISYNVENKYKEFKGSKNEVYKTKLYGSENFSWNLGPKVRTYLNHKEKPLAIKISARATGSYDFSNNFSLASAIEYPLYNGGKNLSSQPLEKEKLSLRSNSTKTFTYNDVQIPYLSASYKNRLFDNSFYKVEAGYLEYTFAGIDLEWYKPLFDDKLGVGLQYQRVYKRKVDDLFKIQKKYSYNAAFINLFYQAIPKYNVNVGLKIGQFLAGDKGARLDITRHYKDFTLGAFATITNSKNIFENEENKGYIDKGIYLKVPLEVFSYKNLKQRVLYPLKPWNRDVGQYSSTRSSLYRMNNSENNSQLMKKHINNLNY